MIDLKTKERMYKLHRLAKNGYGGEAVNAKRRLKRLMEKHGLVLRENGQRV